MENGVVNGVVYGVKRLCLNKEKESLYRGTDF